MIRSFLTRLLVIALCLFPAQSHAYWQSVAQQNAGEPDVTTTDQACLASSGATQTFTAKNFGGGKAGRILAVSINWSDSTLAGTAEITGVTIDANVMSRATRAVGDNQNSNSEIWYAQVTSGTVGDVVVTASSAVDGMTIAIYRLVNYSSKAPVSLATGTTTATATGLISGYATLATASRRASDSTSLSNVTNDYSTACGSFLWGVHGSVLASGSSLATTISPTGDTPLVAMAAWPNGACPDTNWANVILLLPLDGANGATSTTDVSPSARAITFANGAAISTTQSLYGVSSASFDGTNDLLTVPDSTDWDFTGAFTVEVAFRATSTTGNVTRTLIAKRNAASTNISWNLDWFASGSTTLGFEFSTDGTNIAHSLSASATIVADTWYRAAVTRDSGNTMRLYFNGAVIASKINATGTPFNSTNALSIGARANTGAPNIGFEDEVRVTAGVDRYGGAYTPSTGPFPICQ